MEIDLRGLFNILNDRITKTAHNVADAKFALTQALSTTHKVYESGITTPMRT